MAIRVISGGYWQATRHPLMCVLFVLPLLVAYEIGMHLADGETPRNGADVWLRDGLRGVGLSAPLVAPCLIVGILIAWGIWRRQALPTDPLGTVLGMSGESLLFAGGLFALGQAIPSLLAMVQGAGLACTTPCLSIGMDPTCQKVLRYLGAGLYEETLFRLLLFSGLCALFSQWRLPRGMAFLGAALTSALCFAGAHHLGANGEPFHPLVFLFRALAGTYFALVFSCRGFGVAVGAHAGYDVLVGILLRP